MSTPTNRGGLLSRAGQSIARAFGYNAATDSTKRKRSSPVLKDEDEHLTTTGRAKLLGNARDAVRNFAVAGWMVRKHLDFVADHKFQAKTPDKGFNRELEAWVEEVSKEENFDHAGDHDLDRHSRLAEARRIVDGDIGILKLESGHVQAIEGDRIRNPDFGQVRYDQAAEWKHGVRKVSGRKVAYSVHRRTGGGGFQFERVVPAAKMYLYAYHETVMRFDSGRGNSPLAPGLDNMRDVLENFDYALAKAKVSQLFGLKITRNGDTSPAPVTTTTTTDSQGNTKKKAKIDFGNGPVLLDLDPGEDAAFLENKTPPVEYQQFMQAMIAVSLKSIDLPFSFYDEGYTNFFGSRSALLLYLKSCRAKRKDVQKYRTHWFNWRYRMAYAKREIVPPRSLANGFAFGWMPDGLPWWRPSEEIAADIRAIGAGLKTRDDVCMAHFGRSFPETLDLLQSEEDAIRTHRVNVYESPALDTPAAGQVTSPAAFGGLSVAELADALATRLEMEKG